MKNWSAGANYLVSEGLSVRAEINFPKLFAKIVATEEKQLVFYIIPLSLKFTSFMQDACKPLRSTPLLVRVAKVI